jgi:glycosyltransferase involved in cell wall biosynthesis
MRVFVWTGGHTIAESLIQDPPPGITIESNIDTSGQGPSREAGERRFSIDPEHRNSWTELHRPSEPRFLPTLSDADLIHTISGLVPTVPRPWVTTISMPSSFFGLHDEWYRSRRHVWTMMKVLRSSNCKTVMSFSDATHKGFIRLLGDRLGPDDKQKLSVVHPAVNADKFRKKGRAEDDKFRILFVGNHFFDKGGRELFGAVSRIAGRYDVHLDLVTDAPPHHKAALDAFMKSHQQEWVSWHVPKVPRKRLIEKFFPRADVFVMCSYIDVFGFVLVEAGDGLP